MANKFLPLLDSIRSEALKVINIGDKVVLRLVNHEHLSGEIECILTQHQAFMFKGKGFVLQACEIAGILEHNVNPNKVVIVVEGGVADVYSSPEHIIVEIVDLDNGDQLPEE